MLIMISNMLKTPMCPNTVFLTNIWNLAFWVVGIYGLTPKPKNIKEWKKHVLSLVAFSQMNVPILLKQ